MKKYAIALLFALALFGGPKEAKADDVGAVIGGSVGLVTAGPVGLVAGVIIGGVWGRPFWGPPVSPGACWIDNSFRRHCRHMPVAW